MALGIALKFYTSVVKGLKLKVRKFLGLISMSVEVAGEKNSREPQSWKGLRINNENNQCLVMYLEPIWTSAMEDFGEIVNGQKLLTFFAKSSIVDVRLGFKAN